MQDFNHELNELRDLLERADVLGGWTTGFSYQRGDNLAVELNIRLRVRSDAHARPTGAVFDTADIEFQMEVGGECQLDDVAVCTAQVVIDGLSQNGDDLRFALHFDRHDPAQASTELHAQYHWQVGGQRLDGMSITGLLVPEGPRFPSHPLDPVLLVDFVLSHFYGSKRTTLLTNPEYIRYRRLLVASQSRYVTPFFAQILAALAANPFRGTMLWPALSGE